MAAAYIEALISPEEQLYRWNYDSPLGSSVSVNFSFMTSGPSYSSAGEKDGFAVLTDPQKEAARDIFAIYERYINVTFAEVADSNTGDQIRLGRHTGGLEAGYAYTPGEYVALFPSSALSGDIWLTDSAPNLAVEPGDPGYATLLHEVGHSLGLKHPFQAEGDHGALTGTFDSAQYSVMSYTGFPNQIFRRVTGATADDIEFIFVEPTTPMLYDIAALQYLYGANMAYNATNTIYSFANNDPFATCIWDGGGVDTITVSNFSRACTINLNPGTFSSISMISDPLPPGFEGGTQPTYTGANNLSIAFGCTIENATGGSGADRLTGNAVGNTLIGNAGNDIIDGGKGNDKLNGGTGKDKLSGGEGTDTLTCDATDTSINGGVGTADVLKLSKGNLDVNPTKIFDIEVIDLRAGGNNVLMLDKNDVLAISSTDQLKIMGDATDTVDFATALGTPTLSGAFNRYNLGSGAVLFIETDVIVV